MKFDEIIVRSVGRKPETEAFKVARVTQVQPFKVLIENEDESVDLPKVPSLSEPLSVGDYVYLHIRQNRTVVLGKIKPATPPVAPPPPDPNESWQPLPLSSPWSSYSTFGPPRFRKVGDQVEIEGSVRNGAGGSGQPISILPPWARPSSGFRPLIANAGGTMSDLRVDSSGNLYLNQAMSTTGWVLMPNQRFTP